MTNQPTAPRSHLSPEEYEAIRAAEHIAYAALAARWGVEAVGREYPEHVTRPNGYRFTRVGRWYVVRNGDRKPANASQSRALNRVGSHGVSAMQCRGGVHPTPRQRPANAPPTPRQRPANASPTIRANICATFGTAANRKR